VLKNQNIQDRGGALLGCGISKRDFFPIDANRILSIPISSYGMDDFVAWRHNKNNLFSVRSAYHGEWKHQFGEKERNLQAPGQSMVNGVWDSLWKSSVGSKIKKNCVKKLTWYSTLLWSFSKQTCPYIRSVSMVLNPL
jgi:hypothetical protein